VPLTTVGDWEDQRTLLLTNFGSKTLTQAKLEHGGQAENKRWAKNIA
jgi:hypothetical protein